MAQEILARTITAERLREVIHYDPLTGAFAWRVPRKKCVVGARVGSKLPTRYVVIRIDYIRYYAHRLAWLYMTGDWPKEQIDHENRDKTDNRWSNLREATPWENTQNIDWSFRTNSCGHPGIGWHKRDSLWIVTIRRNKKRFTRYFKTFESAVAFYEYAKNPDNPIPRGVSGPKSENLPAP